MVHTRDRHMFDVTTGQRGGKTRRKQTNSKTYGEWKIDLKEVILQGVEWVNLTGDKNI